jgi:tRNA U34 2-thiouridine synthase MnmA/TrmU
MNKKAVALFSGGLDSMLAIRLMLEQGIEVYALHFYFVFTSGTREENEKDLKKFTDLLKIPLKIVDGSEELLEIVKHPRHAVGRNMNPCIDCRIFTFKKAKEYMDEIGASFIFTGEVLGERPLSQRRAAIELIDKHSGLRGLVLRPLSAKLLESTAPEKQGIVDREKLMDIEGRRRVQQISLAKKFDIKDYQNPAGGCLLTDKGFSDKLKDFLKHGVDSDIDSIKLLKIGRHFRISDKLKLVVGRDEKENDILLSFSRPGDYIFDAIDIPSPIGLARSSEASVASFAQKDIEIIASILARYSDSNSKNVNVSYKILPSAEYNSLFVDLASEDLLKLLRI